MEKIIIHGIEVTPPEFRCKKCEHDKLSFRYVESNHAIQMRCASCESWFGNYKYDSRTKDEIRRDKINNWKQARKI